MREMIMIEAKTGSLRCEFGLRQRLAVDEQPVPFKVDQ